MTETTSTLRRRNSVHTKLSRKYSASSWFLLRRTREKPTACRVICYGNSEKELSIIRQDTMPLTQTSWEALWINCHSLQKNKKHKNGWCYFFANFWAAYGCYPCYNNPEGNTLAATEFVRLLEDSGSVTAKQSNGKQGIRSTWVQQ